MVLHATFYANVISYTFILQRKHRIGVVVVKGVDFVVSCSKHQHCQIVLGFFKNQKNVLVGVKQLVNWKLFIWFWQFLHLFRCGCSTIVTYSQPCVNGHLIKCDNLTATSTILKSHFEFISISLLYLLMHLVHNQWNYN